MLHYCYKVVSNYGTIDVNSNCILRSPPKFLDFQMLLYPLKEQLNAPPVFVKVRNNPRRRVQIVSQIGVNDTCLFIPKDNFTKFFGIRFRAFINGKPDDSIRKDSVRQSSFPRNNPVFEAPFCSYHEACANAVDTERVGEIIIASVENIVGSVL